MASNTRAQGLGFRTPSPTDLINTGDDDISQNARAAVDLFDRAIATYENMTAEAYDLPAGYPATVAVLGSVPTKVIRIGVPAGKPGKDGAPGRDGMGYTQGQQLLARTETAEAAAASAAAWAQEAHATTLQPADGVVAAAIGNDLTATAAAGDSRWMRGTRDAHNTLRALVNTNDNSAGTAQGIFIAAPSPGSPHTINGATAQLRMLFGGYDSVLGNALAATMIQGMHSSIDDASTHALLVGGSYHAMIGANYSAILAGTKHTLGVAGQMSNYSGILAGAEHTVTAYYTGSIGGWKNLAAAQGAANLGGRLIENYGEWSIAGGLETKIGSALNTTWGQYTAGLAGYRTKIGTDASARFSGVAGGHSNDVQVEYAFVGGGKQAKPRFHGAQAWAAGAFAAAGDAQMERAVFRGQSLDTNVKQLLVDNVTRLVMPNNTTWSFEGVVTARRASDNQTGAWKIAGVITRGVTAGATDLVGVPTVTPLGATSAAGAWVVDVVADATNGALSIRGRSPSGGTVNWVGGLDLTEVTAA